jgi:hypothetical protein
MDTSLLRKEGHRSQPNRSIFGPVAWMMQVKKDPMQFKKFPMQSSLVLFAQRSGTHIKHENVSERFNFRYFG